MESERIEYLETEEVAKWLRIGPRQVQKLARIGLIKHHRIGKLYRFTEAQVEAYMATTEVELGTR